MGTFRLADDRKSRFEHHFVLRTLCPRYSPRSVLLALRTPNDVVLDLRDPCHFIFRNRADDWLGNDGTILKWRSIWGEPTGLGCVRPHGAGLARNVVGEFANASVGISQLPNRRQQPQ